MRVFVTGATGFVGSAIVLELSRAGHQVVGLARSDETAASLAEAGVEVHRGDLDDLDGLYRGAADSDGVIHTAFVHDFADFGGAVQTDRRAIEALGEALVGSDRPLVVTSGTGFLPTGRLVSEQDVPDPESANPRGATEPVALGFAERGVRVSVLRLPLVHGEGDHGFLSTLVGIARAKGVSAYPGDGTNRWPAVHRLDAAHLFRLALEAAPPGTRLHAVGEEGVPFLDIAGVIGRRLRLPVTAVSAEEAGGHFGWLGHFVTLDTWAGSALTQRLLGWRAVRPGLIADLEVGHYFRDQGTMREAVG
jgi:nucleoside-diphosphate-sugar epimerase